MYCFRFHYTQRIVYIGNNLKGSGNISSPEKVDEAKYLRYEIKNFAHLFVGYSRIVWRGLAEVSSVVIYIEVDNINKQMY